MNLDRARNVVVSPVTLVARRSRRGLGHVCESIGGGSAGSGSTAEGLKADHQKALDRYGDIQRVKVLLALLNKNQAPKDWS